MSYKTTIDIFRKYFQRQIDVTRKTINKIDLPNQPFVTISRLAGAGEVQFPVKLINTLIKKDKEAKENWIYFDKDILEVVLEEHNLPQEISRFMPENKISEIQDVLEQLFGLHPSEHKLIKKISETILHLSNLGNVVFVGRGSNIITKYNKNGIHLRLVSSLENRITNIQKFFKLSKNASIKLIQKDDKERAAYIKKYFNKDINSPLLYTLIINFDMISVDDALELISDEVIKIRSRINRK
ncbi:MAG TPA: cytidylate kinase-like family protein [Ignavibacteria bacterium]